MVLACRPLESTQILRTESLLMRSRSKLRANDALFMIHARSYMSRAVVVRFSLATFSAMFSSSLTVLIAGSEAAYWLCITMGTHVRSTGSSYGAGEKSSLVVREGLRIRLPSKTTDHFPRLSLTP